MPRLFTPLVLGLCFALPARAAETPSAPDPWQAALAFDYNAAADGFSALRKTSPSDGRAAVAYASTLLVRQPRTEANIRAARDLLLSVRESAAADSPESILALFLLARVELDHLAQPDPASAQTRLVQLRREHPAHPLADQAAVELAYLAAYPSGGGDAGAINEIEALLASVTGPVATRDLHVLLASLQLRLRRDPAAALPHLVAARAVGYEQPLRDAGADLVIGNLARETGDLALARRHYEAFLAAAPRDVRASTVRRLLAHLSEPPASVAP
jgi:hypothetical protein